MPQVDPFVTRLQPFRSPGRTPVSYQINRQFSGWILPPQVFAPSGRTANNRLIHRNTTTTSSLSAKSACS